MPEQRRSGGAAARGVASASDSFRVRYVADGSSYVRAVVVSVRATAAAPTAAQQAGFARVVVRIGETPDGTTTATGGQDAYAQPGIVLADVHVPMAYGNPPSVLPLGHRMESGDSLVVEISQGVDNAGAAFDADASVSLSRAGSDYRVTG